MIQDELLTVKETAIRLRVSKRTIFRWINEGKIGAFRTGRRKLVIPESEIINALQPMNDRAREMQD